MTDIFSLAALAIWIYLLGARGFYWRAAVRDDSIPAAPRAWPPVTAVVPARNESECIGASLRSLLRQDYPGPFRVIVVDDDSDDGTAAVAQRIATENPGRELTVMSGNGPPAGWTGKLWALKQGIAAAQAAKPEYVLLTDADIVHAPDTLTWLVAQSKSGCFVLTSLMAKLRCESPAERSHVPAFIYFFQMLFPFAWVNQRGAATAAAAGGCMLVHSEALARAGGIASIRNALIDDCALAQKMKTQGAIWLGLTNRVRSIRRYETLAGVRDMIARCAYAQLRFSPALLVAVSLGMALTFLAAPLLALFGSGPDRWVGLAVWLAMAGSFLPTLRFYRLSPLWVLALPAIATLYLLYTLDSALRHWRRRGGQWKGRVYVNAPSLQ